MKTSLTCLLATAALVLAAWQGAPAQEEAGEGEEEEATLDFSCLYWEGLPAETLYYREGEDFLPIEFRDARRSRSFELRGMAVLELYRDAAEPAEGEPPYDLLNRTEIPASQQVLFVVIPFEGDDGRPRYQVFPMDDSLEAFPPGSFRFANFCEDTLLVKCGDEERRLPALQLSVVRSGKSADGGFVPFIIGNLEGEKVYGTQIFGQPSGRELVFISPPAVEGAMPRVKFVSQLVAPPTEEEEPQPDR